MKSKKELNALKEEAETVSRKRRELTEEGLEKVSGGIDFPSYRLSCTNPNCEINSNTYFSAGSPGMKTVYRVLSAQAGRG